MAAAVHDHRIPVADGLYLHVREWLPAEPRGATVVCLPGLTRTVEDFWALAPYLAAAENGGRRVIAISARGRGLSDRDQDPKRYDVKIEAADALAVSDALRVGSSAFVGTSRGGFQSMMVAALKPEAVRAVVLNDIGPEIERDGLVEIKAMLDDPWRPASFAEAAARLKEKHAPRFTALDDADFDRWARRAWRKTDGAFEPVSDPAIARIFDVVDLDKPIPALWSLFDALKDKPLMLIRAGNSDLLSEAQLGRMVERRPDAVVHHVAGQGHAPLLDDAAAMGAIAKFLGAAGC